MLASCFGLVLVWFVVALGLEQPHNLRSMVLKIDTGFSEHSAAAQLARVRGVAEAVVVPEDGVAYLKVDARLLDNDALETVVGVSRANLEN